MEGVARFGLSFLLIANPALALVESVNHGVEALELSSNRAMTAFATTPTRSLSDSGGRSVLFSTVFSELPATATCRMPIVDVGLIIDENSIHSTEKQFSYRNDIAVAAANHGGCFEGLAKRSTGTPINQTHKNRKSKLPLIAAAMSGKRSGGARLTRRDWMQRHTIAAAAAVGAAVVSSHRCPAWADSMVSDRTSSSTSPTTYPITATETSALCDPLVSSWKKISNGRMVHLLGTAHISSSSAETAGKLVREIRPDAVFVELDEKRVSRARLPDGTSVRRGERPFSSVGEQVGQNVWLGNKGVGVGAFGFACTVFDPLGGLRERVLKASQDAVGGAIRDLYRKLESEGFSAGEEFVVAVKEGLSVGSTIVLGDRDVDVTLQRLTAALAKTDLQRLLRADFEMEESLEGKLPESVVQWQKRAVQSGEFDAEQLRVFVETLKAKENVDRIMAVFREAAPEVYTAMVAERDEYMADGLNRLDQFGTIVAVMGVAHVNGVERRLQEAGWKAMSVNCT